MMCHWQSIMSYIVAVIFVPGDARKCVHSHSYVRIDKEARGEKNKT